MPQPLSPTGEPIQPPPEKSFLQKYGIYIGIAIVFFGRYYLLTMFDFFHAYMYPSALTGGGPPEEGQGGQGGGARQSRR